MRGNAGTAHIRRRVPVQHARQIDRAIQLNA
jgi:hypothetical protein